MNQIRRETIRNFILQKQVVTIKEISELVPDVSSMTIHRDLEKLEQDGEIIRIRGGAMAAAQHPNTESKFETRMQSHIREKRIMAQKALSLIEPESYVLLDAGTSNLVLAQMLPDIEMHIFTTAPNIALELTKLVNPTIHVCGGTLNRSNQAVSGPSTLDMLREINIATAFIGVSGFTIESGFCCGKEEERQVKRLLLEKAKRRIILMDTSKVGAIFPYKIADFDKVDYLVSDGGLPEDVIALAKKNGTVVL